MEGKLVSALGLELGAGFRLGLVRMKIPVKLATQPFKQIPRLRTWRRTNPEQVLVLEKGQ